MKRPRPTRPEEDSAIARAIDWTHYDRLKAQGLADREIARQWGIPWGTFHRERQKREGVPAPVQNRADPSPELMHPPVHPVHTMQAQLYALHGAVQQTVESPIDLRELLQEAMAPVLAQVTALEAEVRALRLHPSAPVHTSVYALHGAEHSALSSEDRKSERWNIYMPRWLRQIIEAEAEATRLSPSQVLQDVVKAWVEQRHKEAP
jgi:hypothetical protein